MTVQTLHAAMVVLALVVAGFGRAFGAEPEAAEHRDVVLEIAPAREWELGGDGKTSFGPSFALAMTPDRASTGSRIWSYPSI